MFSNKKWTTTTTSHAHQPKYTHLYTQKQHCKSSDKKLFHSQNYFNHIWESVSKIESISPVTQSVFVSTITSMKNQIASTYHIPVSEVAMRVEYISNGTFHVTTSNGKQGSDVIDMVSTTIR